MNDQDRTVLDLFRRYPGPSRGRRGSAVLTELGWSETRWAQRLLQLIDQPEVMLAEPVLCARARRIVDAGSRLKRAS